MRGLGLRSWGIGRGLLVGVVMVVGAVPARGRAQAHEDGPGLKEWVSSASSALEPLGRTDEAGLAQATQSLLRVYLNEYEPIESWYGPGAPYGREPLSSAVRRGESRFHEAFGSRDAGEFRELVAALQADLGSILVMAVRAGVPLVPLGEYALPEPSDAAALVRFRTREVRSIARSMREAASHYEAGRTAQALTLVESTYLEEFEPLEARLPGAVSREIESLIHLRLRPMIGRDADVEEVLSVFAAVNAGLGRADGALAGGSSFWFGAVNAFVIIVREGLEAVLLIAAILAYLAGIGAERRARRRIWAGAALGVAASFATWGLARTLVPVSGAGRELIEGITAILAVAVLLYVSHWLFQKTYIHDWKSYLRSRVGRAVTAGSAIAMASLAFAAVYREGFETVLFYQALLFDSSSGAVLAGFVPGGVLILGVGTAVLRIGARLPLKQLFAVTNTILLLLAFAFLGKGIYNLQEAGLFTPHPLGWFPDHAALRQVLGIYPLAETVLAQAGLSVLLLAVLVFYRLRSARRASSPLVTPPVPAEAS